MRSGGLAWSKSDKTTAGGDLATRALLIEHKHVHAKGQSIGLKREWFRKVSQSAKRYGKLPAVGLTLEGETECEADWVILPLSYVKRVMAELFEESEDGDEEAVGETR